MCVCWGVVFVGAGGLPVLVSENKTNVHWYFGVGP